MTTPTPDDPPFWQALPRIATYPFRGASFGILIAVLLLEGLANLPGFGVVFALLAILLPVKFGMEVLRETANGNLEAPEFSVNFSDTLVAKFLALAIGSLIAAVSLGLMVHPLAAIAAFGLLALSMPVMMMTLAIDESLRHAINPLHWGKVIATIGSPYALAATLLATAWIAGGLLTGAAYLAIGGFLAQLLGACIRTVFFLAACHLLGWLVWQHRDALGFQVAGPLMSARARFSRDDQLMAAADADLASGDRTGAIARLAADMKERAVRADIHQRYRELLRAEGDTPGLVEHGRQWLHQRLVEDDRRGAVALARECFELDPDFIAMTPDDLADVAGQAERMGLTALRLSCLRGIAFQAIGEPGWAEGLKIWVDAHRQRHEGTVALREDLVLLSSRCRKAEHRDAVEAILRTLT